MRLSFSSVVAASTSLLSLASAQLAAFSPSGLNGFQYSVNIPDQTASSGQGPIFFQMQAPAGTQWLGLGQGTQMEGANIFMLWAQSSSNVTLSPRLGKGEFEPVYPSASRITLLDGTGIDSSGVMTANVRCDNCLSWDGGSMNPTSGSSPWIWSIKRGDAIDNSDASITSLHQHDTMGTFNYDLTKARGGSSNNPFVSAGSGAPTPPTTVASSEGEESGEVSDTIRRAHAVIMSICFAILFPIFAMTLYLPVPRVVARVHAPLQILTVCLMIAGLGIGAYMAKKLDVAGKYHPVIGYIVTAGIFLFQPIMGFLQHRYFKTNQKRGIFGYLHQWWGRIMITLGIINGGLGFKLTGPVGDDDVPKGGVIAYSVVAGIIFIVWVAVVLFNTIFGGKRGATYLGSESREKDALNGNDSAYHMNNMNRDGNS